MSEQTSEQKNKSAEGETSLRKRSGQNYTKWLGFGTEFGGVIAVFCYIGYRIDAAINTSPYFLLAGFFVSFIGMLYLIIKEVFDIRRK
jgi:F0F1-type ATP synthase assembly protein I